jgi:hypothetical protein
MRNAEPGYNHVYCKTHPQKCPIGQIKKGVKPNKDHLYFCKACGHVDEGIVKEDDK